MKNWMLLAALVAAGCSKKSGDGAGGAAAGGACKPLAVSVAGTAYPAMPHGLARKNVVRSAAYDGFRHAMEHYERAEQLRPHDTDAVLRWNSCVRAIERERLEPEQQGPELPLE